MSEDNSRGRLADPRPTATSVTRRPSPSLAARIKMLEADAEKRNYRGRLSPSPSPHRSRSRAGSELSGVSSAIEVPTSIPTTNLDSGIMPPTPIEYEHTTDTLLDRREPELNGANGITTPPNDTDDTSVASPSTEEQKDIYSPSSFRSGLQRRASVFSLSRISFPAQLSRLTRLSLPLSEELSDRIRNLPTSTDMCEALVGAGTQIGRWIDTAKKVLRGLDAEDDVEWAAQGRESLNEVDSAVKKFSCLMGVYIELIDELQSRPDSDTVESDVLVGIVGAMEETVEGWRSVQKLLKGVKDQVETAMEWTELWTTILQDIQAELDACQTLVFELEEKRHRSMMEENGGSVDIDTLETIMEENSGIFPIANGRSAVQIEDSSLLGLFARMQPLRASLDFLPMRLQGFQNRAQGIFPTACDELESRRTQLERKWKKLNSDADSLKRELGEDRWVAIFRNAGKQASQMLDSIERSMNKLKESVIAWEESGGRGERDLQKRMENYEAKKMHYGSAIQRTFSIIGKGISDRFTVNGEIIRLDSSLRLRWRHLDDQMIELDQTLKDLQLDAQALRDSISSLNSLDILSGTSTPGTSPASSVQLNAPKIPAADRKRSPAACRGQQSSFSSSPSNIPKRGSRQSTPPSLWGMPTPQTGMTRAFSSPSVAGSYTSSSSRLSTTFNPKRPRWNGSTKTDDGSIGHNFKPLTLTTPSPYGKVTPPATRRNSSSLGSRIPMPSPLSQTNTPSSQTSPSQPFIRPGSSASRRSSSSNYLASPSPATRPALKPQASTSRLRSSVAAPSRSASRIGGSNGGPKINVRPASAMASNNVTGRRSSLLPRPTTPNDGNKRSSLPMFGGLTAPTFKDENKPRWRH